MRMVETTTRVPVVFAARKADGHLAAVDSTFARRGECSPSLCDVAAPVDGTCGECERKMAELGLRLLGGEARTWGSTLRYFVNRNITRMRARYRAT